MTKKRRKKERNEEKLKKKMQKDVLYCVADFNPFKDVKIGSFRAGPICAVKNESV